MQPDVDATTRTPGPSTVAPVVNECRNPTSPLATAARSSASETRGARLTRSSNGLVASRGGCVATSRMPGPVERAVDDIHLLLAGQTDEVDGIAGHPDGEAWVLLRVVDCVEEHVAVQHVHVHVISGGAEECVQHRSQVDDPILLDPAETG